MTTLPVQQKFRPEVVRVVSGDLTGSGFMIDPTEVGGLKGIGVSNAHVMGNGSTPHIYSIYSDNERVPVKLLALCHEYDIAFFQIPEATQRILEAHLEEKYNTSEIPYFTFADVSALRIGDKLTAIGHPLGFQHQEFSFGRFKGAQDFGAHPILFTDTELNGGNSGGAAINERNEVVGIASLKMTGHNIDNLNGIRPIDEVKYIIPQFLQLLDTEANEAEKISKAMAAKLGAHAETIANALKEQLPNDFEASFLAQCAGGKVRGEARPFEVWAKRHVLGHDNGDALLNYVVSHVKNNTVEECTRARIEAGGWVELRESLPTVGETKASQAEEPNKLDIQFAAVELHLPIFGISSHPLRTDGEVLHYGHDVSKVDGGVIISDVLPKSLYAKAGGLPGDIIYAVTVGNNTHRLNWQGRSEPVPFGMTLSLDNILRGAAYNSTVTAHVLRPNNVDVDVSFRVVAPTAEELPHVRETYVNTATGMQDAQKIINIAGMQMGALRKQHVAAYQMASFMHPANQYKFQAVIHAVDTNSPAYGLLTKGMRITHVGEEEVANTLEAFSEQLKRATQAPIFRMKAQAEFGTPIQFSIRV